MTAHTLAKFQSAFYAPKLLDNASFEQWTTDGVLDANQRGLRRAQEMLGSYEPPPMDEAVNEALRAYIARREEELPEGVEQGEAPVRHRRFGAMSFVTVDLSRCARRCPACRHG